MKVIHDGDAAYEDIMALCLLLLNADVVAVTVTYGESTPQIGAQNMERVCRMLKPSQKIPVAFGNNKAMDFHGTCFPEFINKEANTILNATEVPQLAEFQVTGSAVNLLYNTLKNSQEKITLVATGPLTNIAELLVLHPECIEKIAQLVIMGGAVNVPGNISDLLPDTKNTVAEWNIYADPKAAEIVFSTVNLPIKLVPIDITRQMPMTKAFYSRLDAETLPTLKLVKDMLTTLLKGMGEDLFYEKLQFWDSLSAMIALNPSLAEFEEFHLAVDLSTGQTRIKATELSDRALIKVATKLCSPEAAYELFIKLMKTDPLPLAGNPLDKHWGGYGAFFGREKPIEFLHHQEELTQCKV